MAGFSGILPGWSLAYMESNPEKQRSGKMGNYSQSILATLLRGTCSHTTTTTQLLWLLWLSETTAMLTQQLVNWSPLNKVLKQISLKSIYFWVCRCPPQGWKSSLTLWYQALYNQATKITLHADLIYFSPPPPNILFFPLKKNIQEQQS